jgi:hypothetical protein
VEIFVSVKRPVTSEGLTSSVTPFPFEVEMFALNDDATIPPLRTPPPPIVHAAELPLALKLPLDCAKEIGAINIGIANANVHTNFFMFIAWLPPILGSKLKL